MASELVGRWRIEEMELWDREAIDLVEPGFIDIGRGEVMMAIGDWPGRDELREQRAGRNRCRQAHQMNKSLHEFSAFVTLQPIPGTIVLASRRVKIESSEQGRLRNGKDNKEYEYQACSDDDCSDCCGTVRSCTIEQ